MSTRHPQLALDEQLCFPLYAATRAVTQRYTELLGEVGLTYPQYLALLALWEAGEPVSVGALGKRLRLDSGTLTPLLKRLEAVGHVTRRRDPADERRVLVEPTEQGWALRERVAEVPARIAGGLGLSLEELVRLRTDLTTLLEALDATAG
ncbi:MarR family winged helix-turn-helix transcriptional regulator [Nocardioides marmotae]|uniref:MarR family winged helix-turn-helix transcriptional regulator n=1 Tax=Nocardioides marmotae TaxID=2663857 RepID=UPI0013289C26|nr:MarR family transcriptional regulator [Nocardioides marmotae]MBC9732377.1 MarR family transcriptional regulator [Nocardioides marmotae]MTB83497.1 MarR family transcriptional regulator [Nocardioides marmotae]